MKLLPTTLTPDQRKKRVTIIIVVVILVLSLVCAILIYYSGKRKGAKDGAIFISSPLAQDGSAPTISEAEVRTLSGELYDDMNGANAFGHNLSPWNRFLACSDSDFIRVNNEFNKTKQKDSGESLKMWLGNESGGGFGDYLVNGNFGAIKDAVLTRMNKLNIQ